MENKDAGLGFQSVFCTNLNHKRLHYIDLQKCLQQNLKIEYYPQENFRTKNCQFTKVDCSYENDLTDDVEAWSYKLHYSNKDNLSILRELFDAEFLTDGCILEDVITIEGLSW